jgi:GTPase SAR1 family protein
LAGRATIYVVGDCHCGKTAFIQSLVTGEKVDASRLPVAGTRSSVPGNDNDNNLTFF